CGWVCQLFAVWTAMRAFDIHSPLPAAGVVLLLMNVVTIFPFWPGNVGLVQFAIASALAGYGVAYSLGVAYGFGLQAIEASVGIVGVSCVQQPRADGGEGTITALCEEWESWSVHDAFGRPRSAAVGERADAVVVEAAQVLPFDLLRLDVMAATSRGLGELLAR